MERVREALLIGGRHRGVRAVEQHQLIRLIADDEDLGPPLHVTVDVGEIVGLELEVAAEVRPELDVMLLGDRGVRIP